MNKVSLDGWCECGLGELRNDGGTADSTGRTGRSGELWFIWRYLKFHAVMFACSRLLLRPSRHAWVAYCRGYALDEALAVN